MKAVMLSIRPEWCALIAQGKKTIDVRKNRPKLETPFKCYIYETLGKSYRRKVFTGEYLRSSEGRGRVIGEFVCDKIVDVDCDSFEPFDKANEKYIDDELCLDRVAFWEYTHGFCAKGWHISGLKIYDRPKELSEFQRAYKRDAENFVVCSHAICPYVNQDGTWACKCADCEDLQEQYKIIRPPQSWCYVEAMQ